MALRLPSGMYSTAPAGVSPPKSRRKNGGSKPGGAGGNVNRSHKVPLRLSGNPELNGKNLS